MKAANDDFIIKTIQRVSIHSRDMERVNKRAELIGTLYLCFAGLMLGSIIGLFIRGF